MKSSLPISTSSSSNGDKPNGWFFQSDLVKTPLGALYKALLEESFWSDTFDVYASLTNKDPFLLVSSPLFQYTAAGTRNFMIKVREDGTAPSVHEVAMMVLENFSAHKIAIRSTIADLEMVANNIEGSGEWKVLTGLAVQAIHAKFPEQRLLENPALSRRLVWFDTPEGLFAVKIEELKKEKAVSVYRLKGHTINRFLDKVHVDYLAAEKMLDESVEHA